jgi:hypothetical protein
MSTEGIAPATGGVNSFLSAEKERFISRTKTLGDEKLIEVLKGPRALMDTKDVICTNEEVIGHIFDNAQSLKKATPAFVEASPQKAYLEAYNKLKELISQSGKEPKIAAHRATKEKTEAAASQTLPTAAATKPKLPGYYSKEQQREQFANKLMERTDFPRVRELFTTAGEILHKKQMDPKQLANLLFNTYEKSKSEENLSSEENKLVKIYKELDSYARAPLETPPQVEEKVTTMAEKIADISKEKVPASKNNFLKFCDFVLSIPRNVGSAFIGAFKQLKKAIVGTNDPKVINEAVRTTNEELQVIISKEEATPEETKIAETLGKFCKKDEKAKMNESISWDDLKLPPKTNQ